MVAGGVLCSGNIVYDLALHRVDEVRWGASTWVESFERHMGGNGANTSYTLGRLRTPVRLLGLIGDDQGGEQVVRQLAGAGVDTSHIGRGKDCTAASVLLIRSDGARAILHRPGVSLEAFREPIDFASCAAGLDHYHLANAFALPGLRRNAVDNLRRARQRGLTTSLDGGWDAEGEWMEALGPCLPHIDLLFVNEDEARMLSGRAEPAAAAGLFLDLGAATVILKLGPAGCAVFRSGGGFTSPAFPVQVTDTTGAGDCFVGGFLAALHHGEDLPEAALFANAVGALSIQRLGATAGLLDWDETRAWMRSRR